MEIFPYFFIPFQEAEGVSFFQFQFPGIGGNEILNEIVEKENSFQGVICGICLFQLTYIGGRGKGVNGVLTVKNINGRKEFTMELDGIKDEFRV